MIAIQIAARSQKRQNHTRRRLTTSSSRSLRLSSPNRLGHGIARLNARSTMPRNAITIRNVARSDVPSPQPSTSCSQMKAAGLVSRATAVADQRRRRHCSARAREDSPMVRGACSAVAIAKG